MQSWSWFGCNTQCAAQCVGAWQPCSRRRIRARGALRRLIDRGPALRIHLYTIGWNEERMLPYFFQHYDRYIERYVTISDSFNRRHTRALGCPGKCYCAAVCAAKA